ncbi:MAG: hypothetical protein HZB29_04475 [Nitrospinae bacterium]|nr:hypothetical protein [Nitrospinota bacterium]
MRRIFFLKSLVLAGLGIAGAMLGLKARPGSNGGSPFCGEGISMAPSDALKKKKWILEKRLGMKSMPGSDY